MAAYRKKASADRDALFGGLGDDSGGGKSKSKKKSSGAASRDELFGNAAGGSSNKPKTKKTTSGPPDPTPDNDPMARLRAMKARGAGKGSRPVLSGEAREAKLKEAQDYRTKANKAMQNSFFQKPDPVAASTLYKRAADCYQHCGDMPKEERLFRLESARCNEQIQAWPSVAIDYSRAADLLQQQMEDGSLRHDQTVADPAQERSQYYQRVAYAWTEQGDKAKAAKAQIQAALALQETSSGKQNAKLSKQALTVMEEAIETHVPDVLNPYARYRQTGTSAFLNPDNPSETLNNPTPETKALALQHLITSSYAHEPLQDIVYLMVQPHLREYPTALYAAGAASVILERGGMATISLSRAYVTETILLLALGHAVAAQQQFLNRHVQHDAYLQARECKLAEDLFRAILNRDPDQLEEARSPQGENKAALANLHSSVKHLVQELRVAGVARKQKTTTSKSSSSGSKPKSSSKKKSAAAPPPPPEPKLEDLAQMKTGYEQEAANGANLDSDALAAELDGLDFDLGDDDDDDGLGGGDDDDDDDFDLR